ncbi:MAG: NAD(+) diphosphatase [Sphingomonadaceae bacterium]|nr:NAD(+) diphosphatase [Sphingomonadaceae bacterium]
MEAPGFTGGTLDRADRLRNDPDALAAAASDLRARLIGMDGLEPRTDESGELVWTSLADAGVDDELILLGLDGDRACFAALPPEPPVDRGAAAIWAAIIGLSAEDAAAFAAARSLIDWHGRHRFCARCGSTTALFRAGWGRACLQCGAEHFPRVDPVVIMLAEHGGRVLVGRQPRYPAGRYSALAGFVEPGESIEEAVARELFEEAGVRATSVRYVVSQPWPFPSSLMMACVAQVAGDALTIDTTELDDAMWVTCDEVEAAMAGAPDARFIAPPRIAIAHTLFRHWLDARSAT